uniref:Solute carrier family 2, facilitated glucose transporter member 11 isoform X3 n=1 Tax=Callorhinus ursinus TaxID=34884 RepID=A0A3Q7N048_CALUR|nr:solute carrier family 2, facilitated glucose transporter member 11 isoform X3 [Callorhinus ursinus]
MLEKCIQGRVLLLTICAAGIGGTFQFGYNLSIINAPTLHIQEFINETWWVRTGQPLPDHLVLLVWSLIVSLYPLGGLFGALLAGPLAVMLGRKKSLLVNNIFVVAAATLFGFSRRAGSFEMIVLGRLLMGVSAGSSWVTQGPGPCCWPAAWCLGCSSLPPSLCFLRAHATSSLTVETPRPACPAAAAGQRGRGGGVGGAGGGARRLRGPARAAPVGAVPGSRPAEAGDEPRGAGQCLGALRERLGVRIRLLRVPGGRDSRGEGPVRRLGDWELRAARGLPQLCADREGGPPFAADRRVQPDDLLGKYLHSGPVPAELLHLDALPGHVLHLCLHPQLWHWPWRDCPTFSICLSSVFVSVGPSILASSSLRPKARPSWRSLRNCTDSTSPGRARALSGRAQKSSCPQSCNSVGDAYTARP